MKSESELTRPLMKKLAIAMPGAEIFKTSDRFTAGIPDISIDWRGHVWLEIKATETERLEHHKNWGLQLLTCQRLERAAQSCWFVIYREIRGLKEVLVLQPREVFEDRHLGVAVWGSAGFNHVGVAQFVKEQLSR